MQLLFDFVFVVGFLLNCLILFLIIKKGNKDFHNKILSIIFLFILLTIVCFYGFLHKIWFLFYPTFIFEDAAAALIGPLMLLYVKAIFLPTKNLVKRNIIHFVVPFLYVLIGTIPLLISLWNKSYLFDYVEWFEDYFSLVIGYSLIYCIISLNVLSRAQNIIKYNYSNTKDIDLNWIKKLLIGSIAVISIDLSTSFYELLFGELEWNTFYLTALGVVILVTHLGYNGIIQSKVLLPVFLLKEHFITEQTTIPNTILIDEQKEEEPKYNESEMMDLKTSLTDLIENKAVFLDADLSLKTLAELLSISDKKLSTLLNQYMAISFYDYINNFRVEAVKKKMNDLSFDQYTLLAIAYESGFNSKTSFNRIFKKTTGLSPSQYKKQRSISLKLVPSLPLGRFVRLDIVHLQQKQKNEQTLLGITTWSLCHNICYRSICNR